MIPPKINVLLADDDPAILRILSRWLERAGYRVRQAQDGQQALAAVETEPPDFLVTDWEMPQVDGLELCRRVRRLDLPHYVYILFLTVRSAPEETVAGLEVGADDFLSKPVNQGELLARMRAGERVLELERRLSLMARTDPLTGLMTQRTFYQSLATEWQRSSRLHLPLSCVMVDFDFFKRINDVHGHPAGDAVLKSVAELLLETCRGSDFVCRYGGEEFCILLPETREHDAAAWAERARQRLASHVTNVGNTELTVTASFGVAERSEDTQTSEQLVDLADQALLCAKQSGRDRVVRFATLGKTATADRETSDRYGSLFAGVAARHVMTTLVACLREDETVGAAAEFFLRSRINSTPVVDRQGKLAGILSEKDLMAAMVSLDCWRRPLREVMKPNVICYDEQTPIQQIYEFLCRVSIRRVVIVNDGRPTGTISRGTLLRWFSNLVESKGLLESSPAEQGRFDFDVYGPKERLAETARTLAHQAIELEKRFHQETDDLVPYVVGGATRMQELVTDLLAFSRFANESATGAASSRSMLTGGDYLD